MSVYLAFNDAVKRTRRFRRGVSRGAPAPPPARGTSHVRRITYADASATSSSSSFSDVFADRPASLASTSTKRIYDF